MEAASPDGRSLIELTLTDDPGIDRIREWIRSSTREAELLPPVSDQVRREALLQVGVTTRSALGAMVYETGGLLIDGGWLRVLGSGHPRLPRSIKNWNEGREGFLLVADDAVGGFFALNGGALGEKVGEIFYWMPDDLTWRSSGLGYTDFIVFALGEKFALFYESLRWPAWRKDIETLGADECFTFYPFLWTKPGSLATSARKPAPVREEFAVRTELAAQIGDLPDGGVFTIEIER